MKLKRIQIKAFRLFDNVDLSFVNQRFTEKGCANFVSIYAPNGFGKTSLFDAIEFGMTSNIRRLKLKNFKENMKYENMLSDFSSFIHNKKSPEEDIHIRLELEGYKNRIVDRVISKSEEQTLLSGDGENKFFSEAILSQDWFSEFLSVNDAETRFKLFMENFHESQDLLEYYSQLKTTATSLTREKGKLTKELNALEKKLQNDIDEHILERLDKVVVDLTALGINVDWKQKIDADSLVKLVMEVEQKIAKENAIKMQADNLLENCEKLNGNQDGLVAVNQISEHLAKIQGKNKQIADFQQKLERIGRLRDLLNLIEKLEKEQRNNIKDLTRLQKLFEDYSRYKLLQSVIDNKTSELAVCDNEIKTLDEQIVNLEKERGILEEARRNQKASLVVIDNEIKSLERDYIQYQNCLKVIESKQIIKTELTEKIARQKTIIESQEEAVTRLLNIQQKVYERKVDIEIEGYEDLSKQIIKLNHRILKHTTKIDELTKSIEQQTAYQNQLSQLVNRSREMVSELKTGVCPLCGHDYTSVEQLLTSIEINSTVPEAIARAISNRDELEKINKRDQQEREEKYQTLKDVIKVAVNNTTQALNNLTGEQKRMKTALREAENTIRLNQEQVNGKFAGFIGLTEEQVEKLYNERKEKLNADIYEKDKAIEEGNKARNALYDNRKEQDSHRKAAQKIMTETRNQKDYLEYQRLLNGDTINEDSLMLWNDGISELKKTIDQYNNQIIKAKGECRMLKDLQQVDLSSEAFLLEEVDKKITEREGLMEQYIKTLQFLKKDCKISGISVKTTVSDIIMLFEDAVRQQKQVSADSEKKLMFLSEYLTMLGIAEKYNQQQLVKKNIQTQKTNICQNNYNQEIVSREMNRLQKYLTEYVKNFFQVERIQMLYNTIDPHPEYKVIKFECDFNYKNPRLNVYVRNKSEDKDTIIPTLYFSKAQINILSFCIFLAKALFAKTNDNQDVGCIFIDDPIQALDDINILSMIDLLRNVAFSLDRQIIMTTHDRNFFELLQKKIPQTKFNSCFIGLKERGKFTMI